VSQPKIQVKTEYKVLFSLFHEFRMGQAMNQQSARKRKERKIFCRRTR